jgi:hypothetical protein
MGRCCHSLLDRGYGKPAQPISQTLTKIAPSTMSDAELAASCGGAFLCFAANPTAVRHIIDWLVMLIHSSPAHVTVGPRG